MLILYGTSLDYDYELTGCVVSSQSELKNDRTLQPLDKQTYSVGS
jgi:hypothetical protein